MLIHKSMSTPSSANSTPLEIRTVLITGATGFVGSHLVDHYVKQGVHVFSACRAPRESAPSPLVTHVHYDMANSFSFKPLPKIDMILHLAWSLEIHDCELNVQATMDLAQSGLNHGVQNQIFFSTFSAHAEAESAYGKGKYKTENFFLSNGLKVCRPGLVVGNGGVYKRMKNVVERQKIIPLLDGGLDLVPVISIEDLCKEIDVFSKNDKQELNLFYQKVPTLRSLLQEMSAGTRSTPLLVAVPVPAIYPFLKIAEFLKLKLPIHTENILGMRANRKSPHKSSL